ncbi:hypothetical protein [Synechococcus sp. B60.1]|uniref:hypothetical protein n=1 Tax=unclassified Synechococcus TaxID=2626047 RepID=UPI0039C23AA8
MRENNLIQLDYRVYRLARLLSEYLNLGELIAVSAGSLEEEPLAPAECSAC